jgi:hypothetical protein
MRIRNQVALGESDASGSLVGQKGGEEGGEAQEEEDQEADCCMAQKVGQEGKLQATSPEEALLATHGCLGIGGAAAASAAALPAAAASSSGNEAADAAGADGVMPAAAGGGATPPPSLCAGSAAFQHYGLGGLGMPADCLPGKVGRGKHSYGVCGLNGSKVDVLVRARSFFIKQGGSAELPLRKSFAWSQFDSLNAAWAATKDAIEFERKFEETPAVNLD